MTSGAVAAGLGGAGLAGAGVRGAGVRGAGLRGAGLRGAGVSVTTEDRSMTSIPYDAGHHRVPAKRRVDDVRANGRVVSGIQIECSYGGPSAAPLRGHPAN